MSFRTNIVFEDMIWDQMQQIPKGERSKTVNEALAQWFRLQNRRAAIKELEKIRENVSSPLSTEEIVSSIRSDRERL